MCMFPVGTAPGTYYVIIVSQEKMRSILFLKIEKLVDSGVVVSRMERDFFDEFYA